MWSAIICITCRRAAASTTAAPRLASLAESAFRSRNRSLFDASSTPARPRLFRLWSGRRMADADETSVARCRRGARAGTELGRASARARPGVQGGRFRRRRLESSSCFVKLGTRRPLESTARSVGLVASQGRFGPCSKPCRAGTRTSRALRRRRARRPPRSAAAIGASAGPCHRFPPA